MFFLRFEKPGVAFITFHTSDKDSKKQGPKSIDLDSFDRPREQIVVLEFQGVLSARVLNRNICCLECFHKSVTGWHWESGHE